MAAIATMPPVDASLAPPAVQLDAFQSAAGGSAQAASPEAIAKSVMSGLQAFSSHENAARTQTAMAIKGSTISAGSTAPAPNTSEPHTGMTTQEMLDRSSELQSKNMTMTMTMYDFALEATLVTNAATTFTSSINTLIKTQ